MVPLCFAFFHSLPFSPFLYSLSPWLLRWIDRQNKGGRRRRTNLQVKPLLFCHGRNNYQQKTKNAQTRFIFVSEKRRKFSFFSALRKLFFLPRKDRMTKVFFFLQENHLKSDHFWKHAPPLFLKQRWLHRKTMVFDFSTVFSSFSSNRKLGSPA